MNREPLTPSPFAVVVNDDPTQLNVLSGLVRKAGMEPRAFTAAEAALAAISAASPPALIVTDLYMPGIDGWRFCRLLRSPEYAAFNLVPILVVSATFAGDEADRIAADLGAEAFLPSPVDGKHFVEQVRLILIGKRMRTPLRVLIVEDSKTLAAYSGRPSKPTATGPIRRSPPGRLTTPSTKPPAMSPCSTTTCPTHSTPNGPRHLYTNLT